MKLSKEMKDALFIVGIFLFLVVATGWLVRDYMQAKAAERGRIGELKGLANIEQMKIDRKIEREIIPLVAKLKAMQEVDRWERQDETIKQGRTIIRIER